MANGSYELARKMEQLKRQYFDSNPGLSDDEKQWTWAGQLQAMSQPSATSPSVSNPARTRRGITRSGRSASFAGHGAARLGLSTTGAIARSREYSQQSAPPTSGPSMSASEALGVKGLGRPSLHALDTAAPGYVDNVFPSSSMEAWQTDSDEPFSSYSSVAVGIRGAQHQPRLTDVNEVAGFEDPESYVGRLPSVSISLSPTVPQPDAPIRQNKHRLSVSSDPPIHGNFATYSPSAQSTAEMTFATTAVSEMSRQQSSQTASSLNEAIGLMRLRSQSTLSDPLQDDLDPFHMEQEPTTCSSVPDPIDLRFTGGVVENSPFGRLSSDLSDQLTEKEISSQKMQRNLSSESNTSHRSVRLSQHLSNGKRPIAPRVDDGAPAMKRQASGSAELDSPSGRSLSKKEIAPATRAARRQKEKLKCKLCDEIPQSFRGEHELRRHILREHGGTRKCWVCVDPNPDKPILAKCKSCRSGKKYNAYYNAAAHLRRCHFATKNQDKCDKNPRKRQGMAAGRWPSMDFLKDYMQEVEVIVEDQTQPGENERERDLDWACDVEPTLHGVVDPDPNIGNLGVFSISGSIVDSGEGYPMQHDTNILLPNYPQYAAMATNADAIDHSPHYDGENSFVTNYDDASYSSLSRGSDTHPGSFPF